MTKNKAYNLQRHTCTYSQNILVVWFEQKLQKLQKSHSRYIQSWSLSFSEVLECYFTLHVRPVTGAFSLAILCKHLIPSPIFTHASHFQVPLRAVAEISPHSMEQCFKTLRLPRPGSRLLRLFGAYAWCNTHLNGRTGLGLGVRKQWDNKLTCVVYRQACDQLDHHTASRLRQQQVYLRSKWWGPEV